MLRNGRRRFGRCAVFTAGSMVAALCGGAVPASAAAPSVPGVTAKSVTVGNVTVLTGPVPGLFLGALNGVKAYFNYVNSTQGGVNGRRLEIKSGDDGYSCSQNASLTQGMVGSVFAFVGNFSVFDACGAAVLGKAPSVADVSYPLDPQTKLLPSLFSPQPQPPGFRTGPFLYLKKRYPNEVKKVGVIYGNTATVDWQQQEGAMKAAGYKIVYQGVDTATTTDYTAYIIRMRSAGVQLLYMTDNTAAQQAAILNQAAQQNWHPKVILLESAYDPHFLPLLKPGAGNGAWFDQTFALFQGEDAAHVPEVKLFDKWIAKTSPGFKPDLYAMYSWAAAALFVKALKSLGAHPTQAGLLAALRKIHDFTDNNMLASADVGRQKPPTCYVMGKLEAGKWVRLAPKTGGFMCKPGGYWLQKS